MEFFNKATAVRLKSHLDKYLVADDDELTVRQSRNGGSLRKARWAVELVDGNPHAIRLKSCCGRYLAASDEPFLLGMTGKKVLQTIPTSSKDASIEWEPIKEGYKVKLRTKGGKFLRANGATPPWRNSITHDLPHRTATQDWVLWEVDEVDVSVLDDNEYLPSNASSFDYSSVRGDYSSPNSPAESPTAAEAAAERLWRSSVASQKRWPSVLSDRSAHNSGRQDGMEFFDKAKAVRLQSHLGKYLVADEDEQTVRQSRNGSSHRARWTVEFVEDGKSNKIRLKSCHGLYLTATEEPFLLGMTGKKVLQTLPEKLNDPTIEWEPVKEGANLKLRTSEGKFLRANGGSPPWRNSITHDVPHRTATQSWVLWGVDVVDISISGLDSVASSGFLSPASSFDSVADDYSGSPDTGLQLTQYSSQRGNMSIKQASAMDIFKKAKSVRLKSFHDKFLKADADEESVVQDRAAGSTRAARWEVVFVEDCDTVIRLKSCYGKYLKASDDEFLLGMTGRKVFQSLPASGKFDSSFDWEPIKEERKVKLKTRYGNFLRANGGLPPWRNSITHDIPHRHHDWVLWGVDVVEVLPESASPLALSCSSSTKHVEEEDEEEDDGGAISIRSLPRNATSPVIEDSPKKSEGRQIYYYIADDNGDVDDSVDPASFKFLGHDLVELTKKLEVETGIEDITVCSRNIVSEKLYPLRLSLPPNNATMNVVVVPPSSKVAREFILPPPPPPPDCLV